MNKRGYTLIEVVVAMGIFLTVTSLAVGAFVTITRMRALTTNMRDSQQKLRLASEKISRLSREANNVTVTNSGRTLDLVFKKNSTSGYKAQFDIVPSGSVYGLTEKECFWISGTDCTLPATGTEMLGGSVELDSTAAFSKSAMGINRLLTIRLDGRISGLSPYYEDQFSLQPTIILEGLK